MANQVTSSASVPAFITKADITSNQGGKTAGLVNGVVRLQYFESILQDTIKATVIYADSGDSVDGKSVIEGLPLVGTIASGIGSMFQPMSPQDRFNQQNFSQLIFKKSNTLLTSKSVCKTKSS